MRRTLLLTASLLIGLAGCAEPGAQTGDETVDTSQGSLVYFGTTGDTSQGIYCARFDETSGRLDFPALAAEARSPGFLEVHPNKRWLYAVGRSKQGADPEWQGVAAYEINRETGMLRFLNAVPSGGRGPCHVTVDSQGRTVAVANYGSGSIATMPILESGELGEAVSAVQHEGSSVNESRQEGPHAHSVNFSADDRYLIAADLGTDEVIVYAHDPATSKIERHSVVKVAAGGGPRHFAFHPSGNYAYVINELLSTVTAFQWDAAAGTLTEIETVPTLPDDFEEENKTAEILVHPNGKFLYGSNRGHDSIAVFSIDTATGKLTFVEREEEGVAWPRNFRIDPSGRYLLVANRDADDVTVYTIDAASGALEPTGDSVSVPGPICVRFLEQ